MATQSILVLGATGSTGRRVAGLLRAAGHRVRAASRRGDVRFDWDDPDMWEPAIGDASRMYVMAPDGTPIDPSFVKLAVRQGVTRIVLLSSRGIETMGDQRLMAAERTIRESGAEWTIVRPSWFNQNFDEGFLQPAVVAGQIAMPLGGLRQAFVDADDIAAVAAAALTEEGHGGRMHEVTGPESISFGDAAEIISRAAGRPVRYDGTPEAFVASQVAIGVPAEEAEGAVRAFDALHDLGDEVPTGTVETVVGRRPRSFATYAAGAAKAGAWR